MQEGCCRSDKGPATQASLCGWCNTINSDLKDATDVENAAMKVFEKLLAATTKQIEALTEKIENKLQRIGTTGLI